MKERAPLLRMQTVVVVLIAGMVVWFSGRPFGAAEAPATPVPTTVAMLPTNSPKPFPTDVVVPTTAPTVAPTLAPTAEPTLEPTAASTPRPEAPDTGQDRSLIYERGDPSKKQVALTFDAGEGPGHTSEILDLLAQYGLHGTFGVTGLWAEQNPDLMRRIVAEGHQIINHTYDHKSYTGASTGLEPLTDDEFRDEVTQAETIIEEVTGGYVAKPYFRFPYGDYSKDALDILGELGFSYTMWWTCDTQGWNGFTPEEIETNCGPDADEGGPGAILLMHVADDNDWAALETLIQSYAAEDYEFVTLEQMIQP